MKKRKKNKEQLRNKFILAERALEDQKIELSIEDIQVNRLDSTESKRLDTKQENEFQGLVKKKKLPVVLLHSELIFKILNLFFLNMAKTVSFISIGLPFFLIREIQKTLSYSLDKAQEARENAEVVITSYLSKVEMGLIDKIEKKKHYEEEKRYEMERYEREIKAFFKETVSSVQLKCENSLFNKTKLSLEFDLSLYEMMSTHLFKYKMIEDVNSLKFSSFIDGKKITNIIKFDLATFDEEWSIAFSSKIASDVFSKIENYEGKVKNTYSYDVTNNTETFVFTFTHQRLDLYMEKTREELDDKVVPSNKFVQLQLDA